MNPASVVCNPAVRAAKFTRTDEEVFCVCDPADGRASMVGSFTRGRLLSPNLAVLDLFCSLLLIIIFTPPKERIAPSVWKSRASYMRVPHLHR